MKYKLISCEVFMRMACLAVAKSPHIIDLDFTRLGAHEDPAALGEQLQSKIDEADGSGEYDAILLGYGLCGNSIAGLKARTLPLVIPRAHDCCTIFLGSKHKFLEHFSEKLSAQWSSVGYMERCDDYLRDTDTGKLMGLDKDYEELVEQFGEENAKYVWETLHPVIDSDELIFIDIPELSHLGSLESFRALADEKSNKLKIIEGDMRIITSLIYGDWHEDDYLLVQPGKQVKALYDQDKVICSE
jgi:hypothetical protein